MKKIFVLFALIISFSVYSLNLNDAREQGLVGEQTDGWLGVVESTPEVEALVKKVNEHRLGKYLQMSEKNGMTLDQVSVLAAEKSIKRTPEGQYIQNASGQWVVK